MFKGQIMKVFGKYPNVLILRKKISEYENKFQSAWSSEISNEHWMSSSSNNGESPIGLVTEAEPVRVC
jgi:hypothetical protein